MVGLGISHSRGRRTSCAAVAEDADRLNAHEELVSLSLFLSQCFAAQTRETRRPLSNPPHAACVVVLRLRATCGRTSHYAPQAQNAVVSSLALALKLARGRTPTLKEVDQPPDQRVTAAYCLGASCLEYAAFQGRDHVLEDCSSQTCAMSCAVQEVPEAVAIQTSPTSPAGDVGRSSTHRGSHVGSSTAEMWSCCGTRLCELRCGSGLDLGPLRSRCHIDSVSEPATGVNAGAIGTRPLVISSLGCFNARAQHCVIDQREDPVALRAFLEGGLGI